MHNKAGDLLHQHMQKAFGENPRGEMYRGIPEERLMTMLRQNIVEVSGAIEHGGNDVLDKLADCGNYLAFIYRNRVEPEGINPLDGELHRLSGLTREQAWYITLHLMKAHELPLVSSLGFGDVLHEASHG